MFSKKKILKHNNDVLFKRNTELNKFCMELQNNLKNIQGINTELENRLVTLGEELKEKKKECKRLKTLLTKNNIEYRKEN